MTFYLKIKRFHQENALENVVFQIVTILSLPQWVNTCLFSKICSLYKVFNCMMTSSNGNIFRVTSLLWGEFIGQWWIPITTASDVELWCFLWSTPAKQLSKQSWGWWFEMPSCSLWCHCNGLRPESTLDKVMACCLEESSHYLNQC